MEKCIIRYIILKLIRRYKIIDLINEVDSNIDLDIEWINLILLAKESGISIDEIKEFLNQSSGPR
ncbi:anti-repressor SinI family protein [Peribacillus simplex]|uniref:Anti-repressor SinI family protein n=2 Tax=Peribacillus TaxID=2675229 RepID=A0AA90PHE0_9BACI|nr:MULTISPECIES: anti-repressor SinI family protein [Peribacillus]MDP1421854.1 anti-repressor SinI family protein [Peribacillus simplex]MDP1454506.1 anti-repressor SinI family protein [Peribacillus frigoritolerans]